MESLGDARYFVTFIDDKTKYIQVIMLRKRSVLNVFKNYKKQVKKKMGCLKRFVRITPKNISARNSTNIYR